MPIVLVSRSTSTLSFNPFSFSPPRAIFQISLFSSAPSGLHTSAMCSHFLSTLYACRCPASREAELLPTCPWAHGVKCARKESQHYHLMYLERKCADCTGRDKIGKALTASTIRKGFAGWRWFWWCGVEVAKARSVREGQA